MLRIRHLLGVVLMTGLLIPCWVEIAHAQDLESPGPRGAIQRTMNDLIRILQDEAFKRADQPEDRRKALEDVLRTRVSYEEMAKRALGSQWATLDEGQRQEFVDLFVSLLRDSFANHVSELAEDRIVYLGEQRYDETFAEVHTQFTGPKVDTSVDFRVINKQGEWLVYDVVVDGASIVYNYRSQFTRVIKAASYTGLVKQLRERRVTLKRFELSVVE